MGRLALLICVVLLSAAMANGIRPAGTVGGAAAALSPVVVTTTAADEVATTTAAATAEITSPPAQQQPPSGDPKDSKRKVPNGPDPIHNRRETPGKRV